MHTPMSFEQKRENLEHMATRHFLLIVCALSHQSTWRTYNKSIHILEARARAPFVVVKYTHKKELAYTEHVP